MYFIRLVLHCHPITNLYKLTLEKIEGLIKNGPQRKWQFGFTR